MGQNKKQLEIKLDKEKIEKDLISLKLLPTYEQLEEEIKRLNKKQK